MTLYIAIVQRASAHALHAGCTQDLNRPAQLRVCRIGEDGGTRANLVAAPPGRGTYAPRTVCRADLRGASRSRATQSPRDARQSSMELSGLAGLNTGDVSKSKPELEPAAQAQTDTLKKKKKITHKAVHSAITGQTVFKEVWRYGLVCSAGDPGL